ncbi:MAG: pyridoxamine 5'-phosphate oxidase family protein [Deltaproteobacteria bacterium]|nr:pyridoxamine 5'-phosphate oxidase family protein [Deltaproteobacteria bacterium]
MDSINENQAEDNYKDLAGQEAVKKIKEVVGKAQTCFFCTQVATGPSLGTRPMNVRKVDEEGNLWFLSANDSHKNEEVEQDREVNLFFQGSPHSDFLQLKGTATISRDKAKIKELWEPVIKTWFTGGVDDPRITVIRVKPLQGYYWDNKHGNAVAGIKMMIGAAVGKTMDDSVEGTLMP